MKIVELSDEVLEFVRAYLTNHQNIPHTGEMAVLHVRALQELSKAQVLEVASEKEPGQEPICP